LLKSYFEIVNEDDERKRREKVNGKIITLDRSLEDTLPYLFGLLGIVAGDDSLAQLDPQLKRRRILEAVKRILARESLNQPLIVVFEDLHWIDSETQALLNLIVDALATARILMLVNYRPEYHHQWGNKTYYTQLRLDPLGRESADEMLTALLGAGLPLFDQPGSGHPLPDQGEGRGEGIAALKRLIIERTEGNPFFMEEMVQALFEQDVLVRNGAVKLAKHLDEIRVPPTVQAILASRIDRLAAGEKELLQTLAVLGREFSSGLIKRVAGKSDDELERMLSELQLGEFIYEQPAMGDIEYTFKNALTLEVAYHSILIERRRLLHERAAQAIEALAAERLDDHLSKLANHYQRSGNTSKAVDYLGRAGWRAAQQAAHTEAIGHLIAAVTLLKELPDDADRARREIDLQMALASSLFLVKGPGADERQPVLARAQALSEQIGDTGRLMKVLLDLSLFRTYRREHRSAADLAERVLALAQTAKDSSMIDGAHLQLGVVQCFRGDFKASCEHLERAPGFIKFGSFHASGSELLPDVLFMLGFPAAALKKSGEFLATARLISDPFSVIDALQTDARLHLQLRDRDIVMERVREILSIAAEHQNAYLIAMATFLRGAAGAGAGEWEQGIADIERAIAEVKTGGAAGNAWMLTALAEAYGKSGRPREGLNAVREALASIEQTDERIYEAELHRVEGDLLLMRNPSEQEQAEQCMRSGIDISRRQAANSLELRATTSLARLLAAQGKREEARKMLTEIYGWFIEGFDTADLKDAKALLDELSH
jgi:tetratricopeptide (TPR) repeat protein